MALRVDPRRSKKELITLLPHGHPYLSMLLRSESALPNVSSSSGTVACHRKYTCWKKAIPQTKGRYKTRTPLPERDISFAAPARALHLQRSEANRSPVVPPKDTLPKVLSKETRRSIVPLHHDHEDFNMQINCHCPVVLFNNRP